MKKGKTWLSVIRKRFDKRVNGAGRNLVLAVLHGANENSGTRLVDLCHSFREGLRINFSESCRNEGNEGEERKFGEKDIMEEEKKK
jgi:hypothetical protein